MSGRCVLGANPSAYRLDFFFTFQNGVESVLIEYELLPRFSVQVERDAYEDYNLGLVLRFRFR